MKPTLHLFYLPECPYCQLVLRAADKLGIELDLVDIRRDPAARQFLLDQRGRATVPVLYDTSGEKPRLVPESRDIVKYLETRSIERRERVL